MYYNKHILLVSQLYQKYNPRLLNKNNGNLLLG